MTGLLIPLWFALAAIVVAALAGVWIGLHWRQRRADRLVIEALDAPDVFDEWPAERRPEVRPS